MKHEVNISANLKWEVTKDRHTGHLVAVCQPLSIVMSGISEADLDANIRETLHLFFSSLLRDGEFDTFLRAQGWEASPMPPQEERDDGALRFHVPWQLVAAGGGNDSTRALC